MSSAFQFQPILVRDYLDGERQAKRRHEYVNGVVYAMSGGTVQHSRIGSNAIIALGAQLRGQKCEVFNSDMKTRVRMSSGTRFYYSDASVVCRQNNANESFQDSPVVIVEVISESTRRTDEYEKCEAYLTIDSLFAYILVGLTSASALVYRRADSGFDREVYKGLDAIIPLPEIQCELSFRELYRNVEFAPIVSEEDEE